MICEQCGASFDPSREVGHLIEIGQIARLCDACAKPAPSLFTTAKPLPSTRRTRISVLHRVDLFDPDGVVRQWMSLIPEYPKPGRKRIPRPGRPGDNLRVFVMSERSQRKPGQPRTKLHTNFELFRRQGTDFKAWKVPGRADALTGIDHIELLASNVVRVVDDGSLEINIYGKDGSRVRLLYKN